MSKSITIFDELNSCNPNPFVDIIFKLTITIKNYSAKRIAGQLYFDNDKKTEPKHVSNDKEEDQAKDDEELDSSDDNDVDKSEERTHYTVKEKLLVKPHQKQIVIRSPT